MKSQRTWLLLASFLLVCGTIGCGDASPPPTAAAPFNAEEANAHQEAWAKYLGVPVEHTNSIGMKLKLIPAGEFMMGSPESVDDTDDKAKPQHKVRITKPFYLGVHEVTQAEYEKVMGENPSNFKGARNPVEQVSWNDAVEFCRKLSAKEGKTYRLPVEAEWEYACRAGTTTLHSFGDNKESLGQYAWYSENSDKKTHPVGEKKPNPWGLYGMHGNVCEWCADYFASYYAVSPTDDPAGPKMGSNRVRRGGSWRFVARICRSANRFWYWPEDGSSVLGFRVAAVPPGESKLVVKKPETLQENPKAAVSHPDVMEEAKPATKKPEAEWQLPPDALQPAIAPFDADQAKQHQQAWAEYLGVPVEITNSIGMKMMLIPPGEFMMGSRYSGPQHKVRITKPFYLGVCEVTQAEYAKVMRENLSKFKAAANPVDQVSWDDAVEFCKKLSAKEGKTYRLPTETEWEYACRAGTTTRFSFGDDLASLGDYAWYRDNSDQKTHPVGAKKPNAWGLHDMHGNMREWCAGWYYYAVSPTDDPPGPETGTNRVLRGGSWRYSALICRAADRHGFMPGARFDDLGFRVAADLSGE